MPPCNGEPLCNPNEIDDGCPVDYLCEGECCVPTCEEGGLIVPPEILAPSPPAAGVLSLGWWLLD